MTIQRQRLNLKFSVADTDKIGSMALARYSVRQIKTIAFGGRDVTAAEIERVLHELGMAVRYKTRRA